MSIGDSIITENKAKTTQGIDFINELPYDVDLFLGPKNLNGEKPNLQSCSARDYVEHYIFPVLLPALNEMLTAAKENLVFERRRTKFNPCDYLTEYLYRNNTNFSGRSGVVLWDIPFVQEILRRKPRPPLPLSLVWSEEEAAIVIQSFWRGYVARRDPEIQELRQYQKDMRANSYHIMIRVEDFWKKHPVEEDVTEEKL